MKRPPSGVFHATYALLALALILLMPVSAHAAISSIGGTVTDADTGAPVASATTLLYEYVPGWILRASGTTNATGGYAFVGWPAGDYRVRVEKAGYMDGRTPLFAFLGGTHDVDIDLWPVAHRVSGRSRFSTAEQIARIREYENPVLCWDSVDDIVIASGDDRAAADPLAAAGLCWAYPNPDGDAAPLFLVSATRTPDEVLVAVKDIVAQSGPPVTIHIVGGTTSVPDARFNELSAYVGPGKLVKHRVQATGSRYDMAAAIARHMKDERPGDMTNIPLIANGADSTKFFDALALSAISGNNGAPIVLVSVGSIPPATQSVIDDMAPARIIIGGGPNTVSAGVETALSDGGTITVDRWSGGNRYATAAKIADNALIEMALGDYSFGLAAKLPDGLSGGATIGGYFGGPLLLTKTDSIPAETLAVINNWHPKNIYLFGGPNSIAESVRMQALATIP